MATSAERSLRAQLAAHSRWAQTDDPAAATAPARRAFDQRFENEVDPEGLLSPTERARRARSARKAYFARLALKSAVSRRRGKELLDTAERIDTELGEFGDDAA